MATIKKIIKNQLNSYSKRLLSLLFVLVTFLTGSSVYQVYAANVADLDGRFTVGVNISWVYVTSGSDTATLAYIQKSDGSSLGPVYCIDNTITASTAAGAYEGMLAEQDVVDSYKSFKFNYHGYDAEVAVEKVLWVVRNGFNADGKPSAGGKTGVVSDPSIVTWENNNINELKERFNIETLYIPEAYQATQLALWYYADPDDTVQASLKLDKLKPNVKALYDALISGAEAAAANSASSLLPEISIDVSFESDEYNNDEYLGPVTVSIDQNPAGCIDINDIQISVELEPGIEITQDTSGTVLDSSIKNGQTFYIDLSGASLSEDMELLTINASVNQSSEIYDAILFSAPNLNWAKQQTLIAATGYQNSMEINDSVKLSASGFGNQFMSLMTARTKGPEEAEIAPWDLDEDMGYGGGDIEYGDDLGYGDGDGDNTALKNTSNSAPSTSDNTNTDLWFMLMICSIFILAVSICSKRNLIADRRFRFRIAKSR